MDVEAIGLATNDLVNLLLGVTVVLAVLLLVQSLRLTAFRRHMVRHAEGLFEAFKERELGAEAARQRDVAQREAAADLAAWKVSQESAIRQDAVTRSEAVINGKVSEQLAPFHPDFPFDPRDARFLGSPIDLVVFDGATADRMRAVVFVEIKSRGSTLSSRQRRIRDAVEAGRVEWLEMRL